jgi:hypothetical protein
MRKGRGLGATSWLCFLTGAVRLIMESAMNKIVRRVTVVRVSGDTCESVVLYKNSDNVNKTSPLLRPIERAVRHIFKAGSVGTQDVYQRHVKSSKRRDGWLIDAPSNVMRASRKAYNEARKGVPFKILPKAN